MLLVHLVSLCKSLTCGCFPGLRSVPSSLQGEAQIGLKGPTAMTLKPPASVLSSPAHEQPTPSKCLLASLITWGNVLFASMLLEWHTDQDANSSTPYQYFQWRPSHSLVPPPPHAHTGENHRRALCSRCSHHSPLLTTKLQPSSKSRLLPDLSPP